MVYYDRVQSLIHTPRSSDIQLTITRPFWAVSHLFGMTADMALEVVDYTTSPPSVDTRVSAGRSQSSTLVC